ncbi:hypothetical protein GDO86_000629 [Hymenochirus boettgeri]|uniref:Complement factor I n=1 Tax=Hymenochirus boettgeri TaxID=247094 RepID=A0A8T2KCG0_9PIPI|nr:hypothetical protein GDO86_000629 [Hymenochirus boettgeri]
MTKLCTVSVLFCLIFVITLTGFFPTGGDAINTCKYNANSCLKVFCAPWQKCVSGTCRCKLPYQCPKNFTTEVCTSGKKKLTYCQQKSLECSSPSNPSFRFSSEYPCIDTFSIKLTLETPSKGNVTDKATNKGIVKVILANSQIESFICAEGWGIKEANVACKHLEYSNGANVSAHSEMSAFKSGDQHCLKVTCRGLENSLAECDIRNISTQGRQIAGVECYTEKKTDCEAGEFTCSNGKCIPLNFSCNGENDCADLSDEVCCPTCSRGFHCKADTCIPMEYRCNGEMDCLGGEDEFNCTEKMTRVNYDMDAERRLLKKSLPELVCGVPPEPKPSKATRKKRVIGGSFATKNQFPWQVAIKDGTAVNCGGIYIGGCWVLTAAHCVRANQPQRYLIMVELLDRLTYDGDLDTFPVKSVKVHESYDPNTYENDIALLEAVNIYNKPECMQTDNNMVPACLPWSPFQFKSGDTCTVSGFGREKGMSKVFHLKWGNVNLMNNCTEVYKERFLDKMECAGTYDGSIDACKGDSGGPLVCYDVNNVAYLWGIVSWGENCGVPGFPGVYTKVAEYYEWIARHVGKPLIAKYNI